MNDLPAPKGRRKQRCVKTETSDGPLVREATHLVAASPDKHLAVLDQGIHGSTGLEHNRTPPRLRRRRKKKRRRRRRRRRRNWIRKEGKRKTITRATTTKNKQINELKKPILQTNYMTRTVYTQGNIIKAR